MGGPGEAGEEGQEEEEEREKVAGFQRHLSNRGRLKKRATE